MPRSLDDKIAAARAAGYSDDEIGQFLADSTGRPSFVPAAETAQPGMGQRFMSGLTTNEEPQGFAGMAGREALPMAGAYAAGAAGLVAGPLGWAAEPAIQGAGGAIGETVRQGVVGLAGGEPSAASIGKTGASYAVGGAVGRGLRTAAPMAGEAFQRGAAWVGKMGPSGMEALDAAAKAPGEVLSRWATNPAAPRVLSEGVRQMADSISTRAGNVYSSATTALQKAMGNKQAVNIAGFKAEAIKVLKKYGYNPQAASDRPVFREVGRLVADATKPFSRSVKGAIDMSKRFTDEMKMGPGKAVERFGDRYQAAIGELKAAWAGRIEKTHKTLGPAWREANNAYGQAAQLVDDSANFLNSKNLGGAVKTATTKGTTDEQLIGRLSQKHQGLSQLLDKLETAMHGQAFARPLGKAAGAAYAYPAHVAQRAAALTNKLGAGVAGRAGEVGLGATANEGSNALTEGINRVRNRR